MPASATVLVRVPASQSQASGLTSGETLRLRRKNCQLTLRQVAGATRRIAEQQDNEEFSISAGRLSEIENKGVVPNIYRLYSLARVYNVELREMLTWFGVPQLP